MCIHNAFAAEYIVHCTDMQKTQLKNFAINQHWQLSFPYESLLSRINQKQEALLSNSQRVAFTELLNYAIIRIPDSTNSIVILRQSGICDIIAPNHRYSIDNVEKPNDSLWSTQWPMERLGLPEAWGISRGDNVLVAIIDTGCDIHHKDLTANLWINYPEDINKSGAFEPWLTTEIRNGINGDINGIDDDNNGWIDDVAGYDFVDQFIPNIGDYAFPDPIITDEQGHGTSVAGIIGAVANNSIGIAGIAPKSKLLNIRAFDATGNAEEDDIAMAIVYAALQKSRIICMSFGDIVYSPLTADAIAFAYAMNCVLISSAGNDGNSLRRYPAGYPYVMAIGATTKSDTKASFSSFGSHISVSAPGISIPTTANGNTYRNFQGTSASAPIVAGAAALLIAINPSYSNNDIKGILQNTATDLGQQGWDPFFGAGRVDILSAVQQHAQYLAGIDSPANDAELKGDSNSVYPIIGSTAIPLFTSYRLEFGYGELPNTWITLQKDSTLRVIKDTLGFFPLYDVLDTIITLKLLIVQTNGKTIEYRNRIRTVASQSTLSLVSFVADSAWIDNRKSTIVRSFFSRPCRVSMKMRKLNSSDPWIFYADDDRAATEHHTILSDIPAGEYECIIMAKTSSDSSITIITLNTAESFAPTTGVIGKPYSLPMTFLYPKQGFSDKNNNPTIIGTDYTLGTYGDTKIFSFKDSVFTCTDSIKQSWIVKGTGDSNGDGIQEILCHSLGEARLFTKKLGSNSSFDTVLFTEQQLPIGISNLREFWSAGMYDLDGDGLEELFGFSDTSLIVMSFKNGAYRLLTKAPNTSPRGSNGSPNTMRPPIIACGDFDKDGKKEIAYGDTDGDFLIFEYDNGLLKQTFSIYTDQTGATEFTGAPDIDGDGNPELLFGRYTNPAMNESREYSTPYWSFSIISSDADNSFKTIHEEKIYGVRAGLDYKNGISFNNLDGIPGDEIVICAFPNLYVFGMKGSEFLPKWYYPVCFSNTAITGDFDKNGKVEFGFGDGIRTVFAEFTNASLKDVPLGLQAISMNDSTALLDWQGNADSYELYYQENPLPNQLNADLLGTTNQTTFKAIGLKNNTLYRFFIKGIYTNGMMSEVSNGVNCYIHTPIFPVSILAVPTLERNTIILKYSGYMSAVFPPSNSFRFIQNDNIYVSSAIPTGQESLTLVLSASLATSTRYSLLCYSINDFYGSPTVVDTLEFITDSLGMPEQELYITNVEILNSTSLTLTFSHNLEKNSSELSSNYNLEPIGRIISSAKLTDKTVKLLLDPAIPLSPIGKEYLIKTKDILGTNGMKLTKGAGSNIGFTLTGDPEHSFCYPQPWYTAKQSTITFAGLPPKAIITIYSIKGDILAQINEYDSNGGVSWNGILSNGEHISSGVYLYSVQNIRDDVQLSPIVKKFSIVH